MPNCLGIYIEKNIIKYAKISKEQEIIKIESFGIKFYDKVGDTISKIIEETFSYKTPISINLSEEMYNYFEIFSLLTKKDMEDAIKTEFESFCTDRGFRENVFEEKHILISSIESKEKIRVVHISANKAEIETKAQLLDGYKVSGISSLPISVMNIVKLKPTDNIAIINVEEKSKITIIMNGTIYTVKNINEGMQEILEKINLKVNSYSKAYEILKNTTIYTENSKALEIDENEFLEDIMPTVYNIVKKSKEELEEFEGKIDKIFITGTIATINNIDLYFKEYFTNAKCEVLKPYFINKTDYKLNIKEYIEVNSAIAIALQGLGEGIQELNFKKADFSTKLAGWLNVEPKKTNKLTNNTKSKKFDISFDLTTRLDSADKMLIRTAAFVLFILIIYIFIASYISTEVNKKVEQTTLETSKLSEQISVIDSNIEKSKTKNNEYAQLIKNLEDLNNNVSEDFRAKNSIPILLNQIMNTVDQDVQITSITNTTGNHIVINAQSEKYDKLGYFKAKLNVDNILINVLSDAAVKQDNVVKVVIEGDLP